MDNKKLVEELRKYFGKINNLNPGEITDGDLRNFVAGAEEIKEELIDSERLRNLYRRVIRIEYQFFVFAFEYLPKDPDDSTLTCSPQLASIEEAVAVKTTTYVRKSSYLADKRKT